MDDKSRIKWEEALPINDLPTWASMAAFLDKRCRMTENCENSLIINPSKQQVLKKSNQPNRHIHVSISSQNKLCFFCDSKENFINNCSRFLNLSPSLRFKEVKNLNYALIACEKVMCLKAVLLVAVVSVLQTTIHCCTLIVLLLIISLLHPWLPALLKLCLFRPMMYKQTQHQRPLQPFSSQQL